MSSSEHIIYKCNNINLFMSQHCEKGHCVTSATAPAVADGTFFYVYQYKQTINVEYLM